MFTVTLLTNPDTPLVDRATVESLRNAWVVAMRAGSTPVSPRNSRCLQCPKTAGRCGRICSP